MIALGAIADSILPATLPSIFTPQLAGLNPASAIEPETLSSPCSSLRSSLTVTVKLDRPTLPFAILIWAPGNFSPSTMRGPSTCSTESPPGRRTLIVPFSTTSSEAW